jgi:hypothetical protein
MPQLCTLSRVYRFNDSAALSLSTGKTVYVSKAHALAIAAALYGVAVDIETVEFTQSGFAPVTHNFKE